MIHKQRHPLERESENGNAKFKIFENDKANLPTEKRINLMTKWTRIEWYSDLVNTNIFHIQTSI